MSGAADRAPSEYLVRPYAPGDREALTALFWRAMVLGRPAPISTDDLIGVAYASFCLDWYLNEGASDAVVAFDDGQLVGYALACTDERRYRRWVRRRWPALVVTIVAAAGRRRLTRDTRSFLRHRSRDSVTLVRRRRHIASDAHAHLNIDIGHRTGALALSLLEAIDDRVRDAGQGAWTGEINSPVGRRATSLARLGFEVVGREPNATLSWLAGSPVERLTVVRAVKSARGRPPPDPVRGEERQPVAAAAGRSYL